MCFFVIKTNNKLTLQKATFFILCEVRFYSNCTHWANSITLDWVALQKFQLNMRLKENNSLSSLSSYVHNL